MSAKKSAKKAPSRQPKTDDKLDQALQDTFPASDPVSLTQPLRRDGPADAEANKRPQSETKRT